MTGPDDAPRDDLDVEWGKLTSVLGAAEAQVAADATRAGARIVRGLRSYVEGTLRAPEPAPEPPDPEAPRTTPAADRVLAVRQALADELSAMGIATSMGADGHAVRRLAAAVLRAVDGAT